MKCIRQIETGEIVRVSNFKAEQMVYETSLWEYIPKRIWKENVRDIKKNNNKKRKKKRSGAKS